MGTTALCSGLLCHRCYNEQFLGWGWSQMVRQLWARGKDVGMPGALGYRGVHATFPLLGLSDCWISPQMGPTVFAPR